MDALVTVHTYHDPFEAEICRGKLESAGIPSQIQKESYQQLLPGQFPWNIYLKVNPDDLEEAKEVLGVESLPAEVESSLYTCPKCGSKNISKNLIKRVLTTLVSILFLYVVRFKNKKCLDCGCQF